MDFDHGLGEACIESWNAQSHPRERLQLVVLDPGNRSNLIRRVRARLAAHDLLITVNTNNEGLLYERGARVAQANILVMTEGHCLAEPGAADEILRAFADPEVAALNLAFSNLEPTTIARQQTLLEQDWVASWPLGHWRTISLRGFAFRREVYRRLGGFRPELRLFCANAFAVELDRRGLRLASTRWPVIRHCNCPGVWSLAFALRDCARGQIAWRAQLQDEQPPDTGDRCFGGLELWSRRGDLARTTARVLASALLRAAFADLRRPGGFQKARHALATLPRLAAAMVAGPRGSALAHRFVLGWAMTACTLARVHKQWLLSSYRRLWQKSFDSGFADSLVAHRIEPQWLTLGAEPVAVASLPDTAVAGLHARETWGPQGPFIRWSGPVFLLHLWLSSERSHRISLEIRSLLPCGERCLTVSLNGSTLASTALQEEAERLTIVLPAEICRPDGRQDLLITCRAMRPCGHGEGDGRRLGLALFTINSNSSE